MRKLSIIFWNILSNKYNLEYDFFMLNNIECFRNVILIVCLKLCHVGRVHWHFIYLTFCDARPAVCTFREVECKMRANVPPQEYSTGLGICMRVASENRDWYVTTYSKNKFLLTPWVFTSELPFKLQNASKRELESKRVLFILPGSALKIILGAGDGRFQLCGQLDWSNGYPLVESTMSPD